ncbi:MAG: DUF4296 domain-containing protein [Bacteroidetes bacterium]|jgi:hypothetical protein|nr:DUF4296 domain-containing protein [Bacteroidota bacterium]MBT3422057.1 DUF4296 domain-containing protein [Bacteroidota bacterium]MBT3802492.1 DUF4296 domain-containing protein [Bacteroidota bacterium]MBT4727049.1 DUF4296 domain-containing protein [Bacteroidota bacterium]MBT5991460.1 DUF4296 domain-containing protein [Bacteroidota bacterium]
MSKLNNYLLIFSLLFIISCGGKKNEKIPDDVIPEKDMVGILIDIHLAEAGVSFSRLERDSFDYYLSNYYFDIFRKHHITKDEFDFSMNFYLDNPNILQAVYEIVNDSLNSLQLIQPE